MCLCNNTGISTENFSLLLPIIFGGSNAADNVLATNVVPELRSPNTYIDVGGIFAVADDVPSRHK
jgi:hypothetical protein